MTTDLPSQREIGRSLGPHQIINPYTPDHDTPKRRGQRLLVTMLVSAFCLIQGFAFAIFGEFMITLFLVPIALLIALVIWVLPASRAIPLRTIEFLYFTFFFVYIAWPDYLALALPGLPWITLIRLTSFPMAFLFLVSLSQSERFRKILSDIISSSGFLWKLIAAFVLVQFISIFLSINKPESIQRFIIAQVILTAVFFVSAYIFSKPQRAERWFYIVWGLAAFTSLLALPEYRMGHVIWAGHIPSFLKIADPTVDAVLQGGGRRYTSIYRVQATFTTSIGFGEFLAMATPVILQFTTGAYRPLTRWAAALTIPFILWIDILTNSRSGLMGMIIAVMLWLFVRGVVAWRTQRDGGLIAPAIVLSFPAAGAAVVASTLFVGRLHRAVWGGAETTSSNEGRVLQWHAGWPKIFHNPFGYGIGQGGPELGFYEANGVLTIDSGYLSGLLEYGFIGFGIFVALILTGIYYALKAPLLDKESKSTYPMLCALGISLIIFLFITSVFAEEAIYSMVFVILGMIAGLTHRNHSSSGAAA